MSDLIGKRVDVLDQGWIELLDLMPHPSSKISGDRAIVNAARTSFLGDSKGDAKDKKLLFYLMRHRHSSPFEMVTFKFRLRAPLVTWWQLVRHRTANLNLQSGRYTPFAENDFYTPTVWRQQSNDNKQASEGVVDPDIASALTDELRLHYAQGYRRYERALKEGVAREQARLFLPGFSVYYTGVWKMDAHNLMHFLTLRMAADAQEEIRVCADAIYTDFFKPALPWTAEAFEKYRLG